MRNKKIEETSPVPGPDVFDFPPVAALAAKQDRELLAGPVEELIKFYGLGKRVTSALVELGCRTGLDIVTLDTNMVLRVAGVTTYRQILLLKEWARMRLPEIKKDIAGPSGETKPIAVGDVGG